LHKFPVIVLESNYFPFLFHGGKDNKNSNIKQLFTVSQFL
jgi:hypothetical protein